MDLTARQKFLDRIITFRKALDSEIVFSQGLDDTEHNKRARILRNGLAIIGYTILEDFLKSRIEEVLNQVSSIGSENISFQRLPKTLRDASIFDALQGLAAYVKQNRKDMNNAILFVQENAAKIASTQTDSYDLSPFSMGWLQSNLTSENIRDSLRIFGVAEGWTAIQKVTSLANINVVDPCQDFQNAASRRHNAAHNADADSLYSDLLSYGKEATAIAFSFDALITKALYFISQQDEGYLEDNKNYIQADSLTIRFIMYNTSNQEWQRFNEIPGSLIESSSDYTELLSSFRGRQNDQDAIIIVKDERNNIIAWELYSFS